jgi:hypothetical protein
VRLYYTAEAGENPQKKKPELNTLTEKGSIHKILLDFAGGAMVE